jgi:hypothetical protein
MSSSITVNMKRSFLVAHDFDIRIFFYVYFNWEDLKWLQICEFLIEIIFILFLNTTLFYNFMLPVNRYLAINIGLWLITKNRIAVRRASPFNTSVHFVCFGEERNVNKCASTSWSSCLWKLCELVSNIEEQLRIVFMLQETYFISTISQFESE